MSGAPDPRAVVAALVAERPAFHHDGEREQVWSARGETLAYLADATKPGDRTLETGSGASTVVFAAAGAVHTAVSPMGHEHERIRAWCRGHGVSTERLEFVEGYSEEVLPGWYPERPLDVAFIDGKHSFPFPIVDWHYVSISVKLGGLLVLDDARAAAVDVLCRFMLADPGWELDAAPDGEAVAFRRVAEAPRGDPWQQQRLASPAELARLLGATPEAPRRARALLRRLRRP
jgi:hypothetical protein